MMLHLSQVVLKFYEAFQLEKKSSNKIDFSDLEHDTLSILSTEKNGVLIAKKYYQELFTEVLIDEYQDVNRVQEAILTSVAKENKSLHGRRRETIDLCLPFSRSIFI